jgi:hypothetical protein
MGSRTDHQLLLCDPTCPAYRLGLVDFGDFEEFLVNTLKSVHSGFELLVLCGKSVIRREVGNELLGVGTFVRKRD